MRGRWTADDVFALGVVTDIVTAGAVLGIGRTKSRDLARRGAFPVSVLRVGVEYRVPVAGLLRLLEIDIGNSEAAPDSPAFATDLTSPTEAGRQGEYPATSAVPGILRVAGSPRSARGGQGSRAG